MSNPTLVSSISAGREVAFVDSRVEDIDSLLRDLGRNVEVVRIDATHDGLAQMAAALGEKGDVAAVHVLAHGSAGSLLLGSTVLDGNLAAHSAQLAAIGRAMAPGGDLLVYGCNVASGEVGAQFLSTLAGLTGADVAASTNRTGSVALGGDWTLETHTGAIEARELVLADFGGVLDILHFTYNADGDDNAADIDGNGDPSTIVKPVSGKNIIFSGDELYIPTDSIGLYALTADHNSYKLKVSAEAGYTFDLSTVQASSFADLNVSMTIVYADGSSLPVNQAIKGSGVTPTAYAVNPGLNDIRSVEFLASDYVTFQDFNITDLKPLPPSTKVSTATLSADNGTAGDFVTNVASQTISGTLTAALGAGEKVEVSYDGGNSWGDAATYAVNSSAWSTTTTLAGSNTFMARVANSVASSTAYSHTYTLDTTAPTTIFSGLALSSDTGTSGTDFITKTASQIITGTLSVPLVGGDVVYGSVDSGNSWTNLTSKVSGTTLTWNGATLVGGTNSVALKVTDLAGNDSGLSSKTYTLDTTAPTTSVATLSFSNDSGTSSSDFITKVAAQTMSGTLSANLAVGETVLVSIDNGVTWATANTTVNTNTWSLDRTLTANNTVKVKVSDTAGNDSTALSQLYVYDTTAPTTTFSGLTLSADTGASNTDFITKTSAQTISGTLSGAVAAGDVVSGSLDNGATWTDITSKVSGTALSWDGVTLSSSNTLQLKVTDSAGNESTVASKAYTLDTSAPATPGTPVLATASDTGLSNSDNITADTTPTLLGTAENGSTVSVYDGATLLGTATAGAGGWSYTTGVLGQGGHTITAVSTDTAGNVSAASASLGITVDSLAPTVGSVGVPANGTYASASALDFTVNFSEAVTVDTTGGTPRISIVVGATTRYADYVSGSGTSALLFRHTVASGDVDANGITVGALSANGGSLRDSAGNDSTLTLNSVGSTAGVNVDGTQPSITNVSASTADGAYRSNDVVTITVNFSTSVTVDTTGGIPTLALGVGGVAIYTGGAGSNTLTFSYTVVPGQNSADLDYASTNALVLNGATIIAAGGSLQPAVLTLPALGATGSLGINKNIVIDTTAPTNTVATAGFSADTGSSSSDLVTKAAAQTISGTLASSLAADEFVYVSLDNGATWTTASAAGTTWSLVGQTLSGSDTLKVRLGDSAGNTGPEYSHSYVLDTTAPSPNPAGATPADNATTAPITGALVLPFLDALDAAGSDPSKVYLKDVATDTLVPATVTIDGSGRLVITPTTSLAYATAYYVTWDAGALKDLAGNAAAAVSNETTYNFTTESAPASGSNPPSTTVDGVPVVTEPGPGGSTIVTIPVVLPTRSDTPGTPSPLADIPIVKGADGHPIVSVSVPTGVGLQAEGLTTSTAGAAALAELGFRIERVTGNNPELTNAGQVFYATLSPNEPLSVQILKPTIGAGYDGTQPLVINGSTNPADGKQAVVIDARGLPSGTVIQVDNIEFVAVVGNVRIIGGAGQNMASGDSGAQYIVLGPDDDVIHGGGGNDTVGSEAGDDQVYGDAGDDIVFGGAAMTCCRAVRAVIV